MRECLCAIRMVWVQSTLCYNTFRGKENMGYPLHWPWFTCFQVAIGGMASQVLITVSLAILSAQQKLNPVILQHYCFILALVIKGFIGYFIKW